MPKTSTYQEQKRRRASRAFEAKVPYQKTMAVSRETRRKLSEVPPERGKGDREKRLRDKRTVVKMFSDR